MNHKHFPATQYTLKLQTTLLNTPLNHHRCIHSVWLLSFTTHMSSDVSSTNSAHYIQCTLQPCTAMYSYLQPTFSAHCSQLQPSTTIYTAAILSSAHCSYTVQCTLHPVHLWTTKGRCNSPVWY